MMKKFTILLVAVFIVLQMNAQNGATINTTGAAGDPSAMLDVSSDNSGILIPRMTETQKNAIPNPATGLMIYQTDGTSGFWYFNGSSWIQSIGVDGATGATGVTGPTGAFVNGTTPGEMLFWDGNAWMSVAPGSHAQSLFFCNGVPTWGYCKPTVLTSNVTVIYGTYATSGGNVTDDGGGTVNLRGVCWSSSPNPTIADDTTINGSGTGSFSAKLTFLSLGTTYYVRAYAINEAGVSYGNQEVFVTLSQLALGDYYGGGIIAYFLQSGDPGYIPGESHGIIAAENDQGLGTPWGCYGTSISGTSTNLNTGQSNTTIIVNGCSSTNIAAYLCDNLSLNGYSDWFLPSFDELGKLYQNQSLIGGFSPNWYWASTEATANDAWGWQMGNGLTSNGLWKTNNYLVRAIRYF